MPIRPENKARYPKDWVAISHRIRFGRAQGQCEWMDGEHRCQARHGEPHPMTLSRVVLTTAHLSDAIEDCSDENLLALCQLHHNRLDAPMRRAGIKSRARAKAAIGELL